jgi:hypothetical protein
MTNTFGNLVVDDLNCIRRFLDFLTLLGLKEHKCISLGEIVDFSDRVLSVKRNKWQMMLSANQ